MDITRIKDASCYEAPEHDGMHMLRLQGKDVSDANSMWTGLLYILPGGGTSLKASNKEKIYVVVEGEVTISNGSEETVLQRLDSCLITRGEGRQLRNETNSPASVLLVMEE
jgi:mannose-6-phosphate isomerase-like protein (cupin superfamily)